MKKIIIIFLFTIHYSLFTAKSQNLVPNPSFETFNSCENDSLFAGIYWGKFPPWNSPSDGSPDGYNSCDTLYYYDVPYNDWGFQYPHSGNGYMGAALYTLTGKIEYSQIKLDSPLVANKYYCASFYVSLCNRSHIACNNFGVYFSDTAIYVHTEYNLNYTPQINDTNVISDTLNWTLISGQYMAHGGEHYIIIGNFYPNSLTDTTHPFPGANLAYYYFDDISVMRCSDVGVEELTKQSNYKLYPNPNNGNMTLEYLLEGSESALFSLYAIDGRLIKQLTLNSNNSTITISATELNAGIYYYTVKEGNNKVETDKLIIIK